MIFNINNKVVNKTYLTIKLRRKMRTKKIFKQITEKKTINIEVDVHNQFIYLEEKQFPFELDDFKKKFLLDGIDEVGFTLQHQNKIEDFEKNYKKTVPWLFK